MSDCPVALVRSSRKKLKVLNSSTHIAASGYPDSSGQMIRQQKGDYLHFMCVCGSRCLNCFSQVRLDERHVGYFQRGRRGKHLEIRTYQSEYDSKGNCDPPLPLVGNEHWLMTISRTRLAADDVLFFLICMFDWSSNFQQFLSVCYITTNCVWSSFKHLNRGLSTAHDIEGPLCSAWPQSPHVSSGQTSCFSLYSPQILKGHNSQMLFKMSKYIPKRKPVNKFSPLG